MANQEVGARGKAEFQRLKAKIEDEDEDEEEAGPLPIG